VWDNLPREVQEQIIAKLKFYVIDAYAVAKQAGMGGRINTSCRPASSPSQGVLPRDEAIAADQELDPKTYGKRGEAW
jgi:pyruvate-ferredoxin/flavodoxin oxidoreductase